VFDHLGGHSRVFPCSFTPGCTCSAVFARFVALALADFDLVENPLTCHPETQCDVPKAAAFRWTQPQGKVLEREEVFFCSLLKLP
jgi:hypothetical protein